MNLRKTVLLVFAGALVLLPGCETTGRKRVSVAPPVPLPAALPAIRPGPLAYWPVSEVSPPKPDPVKELLTHANAAYESGVQAYNAGHLVKAKAEFDRAVDLMLQSDADLRSDPVLEKEFNRLVDNIHAFELSALKEGDGFTERAPVPAPIEQVPELTFPVDPGLREKVLQEVKDTHSDIPLMINDYVLGYLNYFTGRGKSTVMNGLRRAGRYREMIQQVFKEEGVPQDLIYLAQAESLFQPLALSRAGARGIWQFMASRGKEYGLVRDWWVDLRQDPEKSTRAAARHLRDLYQMFGDWYLAMAAYNSGPANVQRAVERTGYADFWELYKRNMLPRETRNYVPIILAVTIMTKNPEKYGLNEVLPDPPIRTETVQIDTPTDLRLIAETIDCSVELLQELNPSLLRWVTPKQGFELRLPAGTRERFLQAVAMIPEDKRVWWRWHRVAAGESLAEIAKNYKTTVAAITNVNNLSSEEPLQEGAKLVIPITPKNPSLMAAAMGDRVREVRLRYRTRRGDTVAHVADRFGVSPEELRQWNRLKSDALPAGRLLLIKAALNASPQAPARRHRASSSKSKSSNKIASRTGRSPRGSKRGAQTSSRRSSSPATTLGTVVARPPVLPR